MWPLLLIIDISAEYVSYVLTVSGAILAIASVNMQTRMKLKYLQNAMKIVEEDEKYKHIRFVKKTIFIKNC